MLQVPNLAKAFPGKDGPAMVIDAVSFAVPEGLCYALLGPSGCGKITTLRCVAGLETASSGGIEIAGTVVFRPEARTRRAHAPSATPSSATRSWR